MEAGSVLFVVLDVGVLALVALGLLADLLAERRELPAIGVAHHKADVARTRADSLHRADHDIGLHAQRRTRGAGKYARGDAAAFARPRAPRAAVDDWCPAADLWLGADRLGSAAPVPRNARHTVVSRDEMWVRGGNPSAATAGGLIMAIRSATRWLATKARIGISELPANTGWLLRKAVSAPGEAVGTARHGVRRTRDAVADRVPIGSDSLEQRMNRAHHAVERANQAEQEAVEAAQQARALDDEAQQVAEQGRERLADAKQEGDAEVDQRVQEVQRRADEMVAQQRAKAEADIERRLQRLEGEIDAKNARAQAKAQQAHERAEGMAEAASQQMAAARQMAEDAAKAAEEAADEARREAQELSDRVTDVNANKDAAGSRKTQAEADRAEAKRKRKNAAKDAETGQADAPGAKQNKSTGATK